MGKAGSYTNKPVLSGSENWAAKDGAGTTVNITAQSVADLSDADVDAVEAALAAHIADTSDAHDASAISFAPDGTIAATDVQGAVAEVASEAAAAIAVVKPGQVLDTTVYNPVSLATYAATSTSFADMDGTNLTTVFTVPPSGQVLVRLTAMIACGGSTSLKWNLRDSVSGDIAGTAARIGFASVPQTRSTHEVLVTGLTPGASLTWAWGHARDTGANNANSFAGSDTGQAVMVVQAA